MSARAIARRFHRDHHTVLRALEPRRLESLAADLAFKGREYEAVELATQIGDPKLLAWVERILQLVLGIQRQHEQKVNETLLDAG